MIIKRILVFIMAIFTLLSNKFGVEINTSKEKAESFAVKSYFTADSIQNPDRIYSEDFDIITDAILFGCATFDSEGNVHVEKEKLETALNNLRAKIGSRDVKITLNLLGPSGHTDSDVWEDQMQALSQAHNEAFKSGVLEDNIIAVLDEYNFDGVHFDYEYPMGAKAWYHFNNFLVSLNKKLGDYSLAVAASDWDLNFSTAALKAVDCIELMLYDNYDSEGRHSSFETAVEGAKKAALAAIPSEKVTFGLPFYSRPSDRGAYWYGYDGYYNKLDENGWYHCDDVNKDFWFNTPDVIEKKTDYAINNGFAGVMIWHYACDLPSSDEMSLLGAIGKAVNDNY